MLHLNLAYWLNFIPSTYKYVDQYLCIYEPNFRREVVPYDTNTLQNCYSFKRAAIGFRDELIYKLHNNICMHFLKNNFLCK